MLRSRRFAAEVMPLVLALVLVSCGGSDAAPATTTSTTSMATTTTTTAPTTTTTAAPTTSDDDQGTSGEELPTTLTAGTYLVGDEIRTGFWVSDQCGCPWYHVDEMGNKTQGTTEDAEVTDADVEIELGSCTWTWNG